MKRESVISLAEKVLGGSQRPMISQTDIRETNG